MWNRNFPGVLLLLCLAGCNSNGFIHGMEEQPKIGPLDASDFFPDGRGARPLVSGTVPRGWLRDDEHLYTGKVRGKLVTTFPWPVTTDVLHRGRERYEIFCAACHDRVGTGEGMIVRRGFSKPPSFHSDRLRQAPVGHFFDVVTNGFGAMYSYHDRIPVNDRWAIIAYIRALQLSQNTRFSDLRPSEQQALLSQARRDLSRE